MLFQRSLSVKKIRRMCCFEILRTHAAEERGGADFVVHINARRTAADGIHPRKVRGGAFQRIVDALDVIVRIALEIRIPDDFLGKHHLAIDQRGAFSIGPAEIEADAAAFEIAAEGHHRVVGGGQFGGSRSLFTLIGSPKILVPMKPQSKVRSPVSE